MYIYIYIYTYIILYHIPVFVLIAKVLGVGMCKATLRDCSFTPGTASAGVALHVILDDHAIHRLAHQTSGIHRRKLRDN